MSRLRIRMELNRGGVGVPLHKLAHVVDEAQKFFRMLGDDVHIGNGGEWLGFDFDNKSLNFTAEYVGPVDPAQVREFQAAFDGVTLLRRATIAQFARIADGIGEDELIGFGLYQNDEETEPMEWRSLSKRDALRIIEEIRLLAGRAGESQTESRLPAALDPNAAANLFKERHGHGGVTERLARLENEVGQHSEAIQTLRGTTAKTEQNLEKLLVTVDAFCDRATRQIERLPAPPTPEPRKIRWLVPLYIAGVCLAVAGWVIFHGTSGSRSTAGDVRADVSIPVVPAPILPPAPAPISTPAPSKSLKVEIKALEPTWVSAFIDDKQTFAKMIEADRTEDIESAGKVRVRLGNAGGVEIVFNGKPLGPLGQKGQVKTLEFTDEGFHVVTAAKH